MLRLYGDVEMSVLTNYTEVALNAWSDIMCSYAAKTAL